MATDYTYTDSIDDSSEVSIKITVKQEKFEAEKEVVLKRLSKKLKTKGFREGKVPAKMAESMLGPSLYEETLNSLLPQITVEVMKELSYEPVTRVEYNVTSLGEGKDVEYEAKFVNFPKIKLADFSKIKVKKDSIDIKEADITKVLDGMFEDWKSHEEGGREGEENKEEAKKDKKESKYAKPTDEWVKELKLDNITNLKELKEQIKITLEKQREQVVEEKYQVDVLKEAVELSKVKAPERIVELELGQQETAYKTRIEGLGLTLDDFLRSQKTSLEDMKKEWKEKIEEKVALDLLLVAIVRKNEIKVEPSEIDHEISHIQDPKMKEEYDSPQGRAQIMDVMLKQKAIKIVLDEVTGKKK